MKDKYKIKRQLIDELVAARGRIAKLEGQNAELRMCLDMQQATLAARPPLSAVRVPKIGEILVAKGYLCTSQLHRALEMQRNATCRATLGKILVEAGMVTSEQLHCGLMEQLNVLRSRLLAA